MTPERIKEIESHFANWIPSKATCFVKELLAENASLKAELEDANRQIVRLATEVTELRLEMQDTRELRARMEKGIPGYWFARDKGSNDHWLFDRQPEVDDEYGYGHGMFIGEFDSFIKPGTCREVLIIPKE